MCGELCRQEMNKKRPVHVANLNRGERKRLSPAHIFPALFFWINLTARNSSVTLPSLFHIFWVHLLTSLSQFLSPHPKLKKKRKKGTRRIPGLGLPRPALPDSGESQSLRPVSLHLQSGNNHKGPGHHTATCDQRVGVSVQKLTSQESASLCLLSDVSQLSGGPRCRRLQEPPCLIICSHHSPKVSLVPFVSIPLYSLCFSDIFSSNKLISHQYL